MTKGDTCHLGTPVNGQNTRLTLFSVGVLVVGTP